MTRANHPRQSPQGHSSPGEVRAADKARALAYFSGLASTYESRVESWPLRSLRSRERQAVLELGRWTAGKSFVDVGCGSGFYARHAKAAGMRVTVTDASEAMVRAASTWADEAKVADVEELELGVSFYGVVCAGVLDFVLRPEVALGNLFKHMSEDGWLVVLLPRKCLGGLLYRVEKQLRRMRVNLFSRDWLEEQARRAQLRITGYVEPLPYNLVVRFERA